MKEWILAFVDWSAKRGQIESRGNHAGRYVLRKRRQIAI